MDSPPRIVTIEADFTLRDLFAAAAMAGIARAGVASEERHGYVPAAVLAYAYADAMLEVRGWSQP